MQVGLDVRTLYLYYMICIYLIHSKIYAKRLSIPMSIATLRLKTRIINYCEERSEGIHTGNKVGRVSLLYLAKGSGSERCLRNNQVGFRDI